MSNEFPTVSGVCNLSLALNQKFFFLAQEINSVAIFLEQIANGELQKVCQPQLFQNLADINAKKLRKVFEFFEELELAHL